MPIGLVTGGQAICWLGIKVSGQAAYTGTTPLNHIAPFGVGEVVTALEQLARHIN